MEDKVKYYILADNLHTLHSNQSIPFQLFATIAKLNTRYPFCIFPPMTNQSNLILFTQCTVVVTPLLFHIDSLVTYEHTHTGTHMHARARTHKSPQTHIHKQKSIICSTCEMPAVQLYAQDKHHLKPFFGTRWEHCDAGKGNILKGQMSCRLFRVPF